MRDPFVPPLPWGGVQWPVDGIAPDPPPIPATTPPLVPPCVGAVVSAITPNGASTTLTFGATAQTGDGIVLFVTVGQTGAVTLSAKTNNGDQFNVYGNTFTSFISSIYLLWLPFSRGGNPTITVTSSAASWITGVALQIVGANSGWFIGEVAGLHVAAATTIRPILRTLQPNELMLIAATETGFSSSIPQANYGIIRQSMKSSTACETVVGWSLVTQPSGQLGPQVNYANAQGGAITVSIRTKPYTVSQDAPPSALVSLPQGLPVGPLISVPPAWYETFIAPSGGGDVTANLGGQSGTFAEGTATPAIDLFPTGQTGNFLEGILSPTGGDAAPPSQAGGTGTARRKIKKAQEVFEEELARIEAQLAAARAAREGIEQKLSEVEPSSAPTVPPSVQQFIIREQHAIEAAQRREAALPQAVPVYLRLPKKSVGVRRVEAVERLRMLARIARYREQLAEEKARKLREKYDEDAAIYLMQLLMWEWE